MPNNQYNDFCISKDLCIKDNTNGFKVVLDAAGSVPDPITAIYRFQGVGVTEKFTYDRTTPDNAEQIIIDKQLKTGHFGVLSAAFFTIHTQGFPHDTIMQWVRHQDLKPQVQSMRYTGDRFSTTTLVNTDEVFYIPAIGNYGSKEGTYTLTAQAQLEYRYACFKSSIDYCKLVHQGMPKELARRVLAPAFRQNMTLTGTLQGFLHALDQRGLADTQTEARWLADSIVGLLEQRMPGIMGWYKANRYGKNKLAP